MNKLKACFLYAILSLVLLCACNADNDNPPAQTEPTPTPVWDGTDADTHETSDEQQINVYTEPCEVDPDKKDTIHEFGVEHIYTRTLSSGEVQTYTETEITSTQRVCNHTPPVEAWDGTDADSFEVSEVKWLESYRTPCKFYYNATDGMQAEGVEYTLKRTLPSGEEQICVIPVVTHTVRECNHIEPRAKSHGNTNITFEEGEPYMAETYDKPCELRPDCTDTVTRYVKDYTIIYTVTFSQVYTAEEFAQMDPIKEKDNVTLEYETYTNNDGITFVLMTSTAITTDTKTVETETFYTCGHEPILSGADQ